MPIIPMVRCSNMMRSLKFYTEILDFKRIDGDEPPVDPCFSALSREGEQIWLSSHAGDGEFGQALVVLTNDVDALFEKLVGRGLIPEQFGGGSEVHQSPVDQTWGNREFYVDDPDGNTMRFTQVLSS